MDVRVRFTQAVVTEAFLSLLKEQNIDSITVRGICDKAGINRTTFYRYYDNPYDLMNKTENKLLDELKQKIDGQEVLTLEKMFAIILGDICSKRDLYLALFSANGDALFRERVFDICRAHCMKIIESVFPELGEEKSTWLYYFIAEGANGILNRWINDGMTALPEELISFLTRIIEGINKGTRF